MSVVWKRMDTGGNSSCRLCRLYQCQHPGRGWIQEAIHRAVLVEQTLPRSVADSTNVSSLEEDGYRRQFIVPSLQTLPMSVAWERRDTGDNSSLRS